MICSTWTRPYCSCIRRPLTILTGYSTWRAPTPEGSLTRGGRNTLPPRQGVLHDRPAGHDTSQEQPAAHKSHTGVRMASTPSSLTKGLQILIPQLFPLRFVVLCIQPWQETLEDKVSGHKRTGSWCRHLTDCFYRGIGGGSNRQEDHVVVGWVRPHVQRCISVSALLHSSPRACPSPRTALQ
jgi:hypothetical protein